LRGRKSTEMLPVSLGVTRVLSLKAKLVAALLLSPRLQTELCAVIVTLALSLIIRSLLFDLDL
jgi:hypothetical protein